MVTITESTFASPGRSKRGRDAARHRKNKADIDFRNEMIVKYLPLVRMIAADMCSRTSANIEYDDLVSTGVFGLMDAIKNFDSGRNVKFSTYCKQRIRGAMLDDLRQQDWVPRLARKQRNQIGRAQAVLEDRLNRKPSHDELAAELNVSHDELTKISRDSELVNVVSMEQVTGRHDCDQTRYDSIKDDAAIDPAFELQKKDSRNLITRSLGRLERMIVTLYYYEQLTMRQIGKTLNISESRVSQIHTELLKQLKDRISANREDFVLAL